MSGLSGKARLDERGRLVLPAALRRRLGMQAGDELVIREESDGALRVETRRTAARALIGLAGSTELPAVEQLRTERRREAAGEDTDARRGESAR